MMPISPYISPYMEKKHRGKTVISLNGKILGIGENALIAVEKARKIMPGIDREEYLISHIRYGIYA